MIRCQVGAPDLLLRFTAFDHTEWLQRLETPHYTEISSDISVNVNTPVPLCIVLKPIRLPCFLHDLIT